MTERALAGRRIVVLGAAGGLGRSVTKRWPKPAELAAVLAFLVSDDATLISGAAIPVYGRA